MSEDGVSCMNTRTTSSNGSTVMKMAAEFCLHINIDDLLKQNNVEAEDEKLLEVNKNFILVTGRGGP
jgi:FlaA1/EpsC-like NDP-sugar epimerase